MQCNKSNWKSTDSNEIEPRFTDKNQNSKPFGIASIIVGEARSLGPKTATVADVVALYQKYRIALVGRDIFRQTPFHKQISQMLQYVYVLQ
jgi:hypothetical protein